MDRIQFLLLAQLLGGLVSCSIPSFSKQTADPFGSEEDASQAAALQSDLYDYVDIFSARIAGTADDIAEASGDRDVRELTLRWKLRAIPTMRQAANHPDPRRGFLDAWFLTVRLRILFSNGSGKELLGSSNHLAAQAMQALEERVEKIGRSFLSASDFTEAEKEIDALAAGHPISGRFSSDLRRASGEVSEAQHHGLFSLLSIQLSGLKEGAEAVNRLAHVAGIASDVIASMPEETRWQLELALLELQKLEKDDAFLQELAHLRASSDALAAIVAKLPAELGGELEAVLRATEGPLKEARATLTQLQSTVEATEQLATKTEAVMAGVQDAANAWKATAAEVKLVMGAIDSLSSTAPGAGSAEPSGEPSAWSFRDLARAGDSVRGGAVELRALLGEAESGQLRENLTELGGVADDSILRGSQQIRSLVDRAALLGAALLTFFLLGLYAVRRGTRGR